MSDCIHINADCRSVIPGVSQCHKCGQVFIFTCSSGVGRYKKIEDITDDDVADFSPL